MKRQTIEDLYAAAVISKQERDRFILEHDRLMVLPDLEKYDPPPCTVAVDRIAYTGEDIEPTQWHNLMAECQYAEDLMRDGKAPKATWPALKRYVKKALKLLDQIEEARRISTPDPKPDE